MTNEIERALIELRAECLRRFDAQSHIHMGPTKAEPLLTACIDTFGRLSWINEPVPRLFYGRFTSIINCALLVLLTILSIAESSMKSYSQG